MSGDYEKNVGGGDQGSLFDLDGLDDATQASAKDLARWLDDLHDRNRNETIRKSIEYGSADLEVMGNALQMMLVPAEKREVALGLEMACGFYALGKVARILGAFERGERPSGDSIFDLMVYAQMMLKIRETGRWF